MTINRYDKIRAVPRYQVQVGIEIKHLETDLAMRGQTSVLSVRGCGGAMPSKLTSGLRVIIRLSRGKADLLVAGRVAYSRPGVGFGIEFVAVEPKVEATLREWIGGS